MLVSELKELLNLDAEQEDAFDSLVNISNTSPITIDDVQEAIDADTGELADSACDVYTGELLQWYMDDYGRMEYANQAINELGSKDFSSILMGGQYLYYSEKMSELQRILTDKISGIETLDELVTPAEPEQPKAGQEWEKRWQRRSGVIDELTVSAREVIL